MDNDLLQLQSYCKNPDHNKGCLTKCPCGRWINCRYYIDKEKQLKRIKWRQEHDKKIKKIQEWYTDIYREHWSVDATICANG